MRTTTKRREQEAKQRKERALRVGCPECRAKAGWPCTSTMAVETLNYLHTKRYDRAEGRGRR